MSRTLEFWVAGIPRPGGSKRGFYNAKLKRVLMVKDGGQREENWRQAVSYAAMRAMEERDPLLGPIRLDVVFYLPRPKAHCRTGKFAGVLKDNAPTWHIKTPDRGKLLRSTEDAMKGIVYADDSQVCDGRLRKMYSQKPGATIRVEQLDPAPKAEPQDTAEAANVNMDGCYWCPVCREEVSTERLTFEERCPDCGHEAEWKTAEPMADLSQHTPCSKCGKSRGYANGLCIKCFQEGRE